MPKRCYNSSLIAFYGGSTHLNFDMKPSKAKVHFTKLSQTQNAFR